MNEGWVCPRCGVVHAPCIPTCTSCQKKTTTAPFSQPWTVTAGCKHHPDRTKCLICMPYSMSTGTLTVSG